MIITNGSKLVLRLDLEDKGKRFRVAETNQFQVKVYTTNKSKFVLFKYDDVIQGEEFDGIDIPALYLNALDSGVVVYQYIYAMEDGYKKVREVITDFYWKNTDKTNLPSDSENGITAVDKSTFEKFEDETRGELGNINEKLEQLEEASSKHINREDNSVVYDYDDKEVINELFIVEGEDDDSQIYWKDEIDSLIEETKQYADSKVEEQTSFNEETYAKKEDIPTDYITEHQDLSEYLKTADAEEMFQPKGNYLTEHQDISDLATKEELKALTPDLSNYYTKSQCDATFLSEHQSLRGYLTEDEADRMYASKEDLEEKFKDATDIDLSGYASKVELQNAVSGLANKSDIPDVSKFLTQHQSLEGYAKLTDIPEVPSIEGLATEDWVNDRGFLTQHQDLSKYALKADVPTVPSRLSDFINDCGFISQEINLSDFATYGYLAKKYYDKEDSDDRYLIKAECVDKYYTKDDIDSLMVTMDKLSEYASKNDLKALSDAFNSHTDEFANFALKASVYTKEEVDKKVADVDVTEQLQDYAKKTDIPDVSEFLTEHQSLANYYTKAQCDSKFLTQHQDLSNYTTRDYVYNYFYTKSQIDGKGFLTQHQSLEGYAKKTDIPTVPSLEGYATEGWVKNQGFLTQHQSLEDYVKNSDLNNYYDKTDVEAMHTMLEKRFDNYYNKLETENLIRAFLQYIEKPDLGAYITILEADERYISPLELEHTLCKYYNKEEVDEAILNAQLKGVEGEIDLTMYLKKSEAENLYQHKGDYVTKQYVDDEIKKIEVPQLQIEKITEADIRSLLN